MMNSNHFRQFNPNPDGIRVGDGTVRVISKATGKQRSNPYFREVAYVPV